MNQPLDPKQLQGPGGLTISTGQVWQLGMESLGVVLGFQSVERWKNPLRWVIVQRSRVVLSPSF